MYDYRILFAILGATIGLLSFVPYFRDILNRSTKPHVFSWFIWSILVGITFFIQVTEGGGIGALVTGIESLCCAAVTVFAFTRGEKNITRSDWICLCLALLAIALWLLAHQPLLSVLLVICADMLAYIPTFRKSYVRPHEETALQFAMSSVHWVLAIVALQTFLLTTWLYPAWMAVFDAVLVATILIRRRTVDRKTASDSV